ncbi:MAG: AbiJ-NTD4 domain-containing protein [Candidatus Thorarchaeota archaeon]|jgi:hypothetical protein
MKLFSHRKGLKPVKMEVQTDDMDDDLRVGLWNVFVTFYWRRGGMDVSEPEGNRMLKMMWYHYFKRPIDTLSDVPGEPYKEIRDYFFGCKWYEVYDFIEFVVMTYSNEDKNSEFKKTCNLALTRELSAFRFVGDKITTVTSSEEIAEIEEALAAPIDPIRDHLKSALDLLADRESPDYRNSIKESISAIESICKKIAQDDKATLGQALKIIKSKIQLHSDLKEAFRKLYHYTCDADGIRHALMDKTNLDFEDAKFMLVCCSAFINYLLSKSSKLGIKL